MTVIETREQAILALEEIGKISSGDSTKFIINDYLIDQALQQRSVDDLYINTKTQDYRYFEIELSGTVGVDANLFGGVQGSGTITGTLAYSQKDGWLLKPSGQVNAIIKLEAEGTLSKQGFQSILQQGVEVSNGTVGLSGGLIENGGYAGAAIDAKALKITAGATVEDGKITEANLGVSRDFIPSDLLIAEAGVNIIYKNDGVTNIMSPDKAYYGSGDGDYYAIRGEVFNAFGAISEEVIEYFGDVSRLEARTEFENIIRDNIEIDGLAPHVALANAVVSITGDPTGEFDPATASLKDSVDLARGEYDPDKVTFEENTETTIEEQFGEIVVAAHTSESIITTAQTYMIQVESPDGTFDEIILSPAARGIAKHQSRVEDFETNGTVISQLTETEFLYGGTYDKQTRIIEKNGELIKVVDYNLNADSPAASNGIVSYKKSFETDSNGDFYIAAEDTQFFDRGGVLHETSEFRETSLSGWTIQQSAQNASGEMVAGHAYIVPKADAKAAFELGGTAIGGAVADLLADDSVYKQIVYGSVLKAIGQHFGTVGAFLSAGNTIEAAVSTVNKLDIQGINTEVLTPAFVETVYQNLGNSISSVVAGRIVGEVGEALGLEGVALDVFGAAGGQVVTPFVTNGLNFVFNTVGLPGFSDEVSTIFNADDAFGNFQAAALNFAAAYVGSRLGESVIEAESEFAAKFSAAYSAIGSAVAGIVSGGNPAVIAIGNFLSEVQGAFYGNLLSGILGKDGDPEAWAHIGFNHTNQEFKIGQIWGKDGGDPLLAQDLAQQAIAGVNAIIEVSNGKLRSGQSAPQGYIGMDGDTYIVSFAGQQEQHFGVAADAITHAAFQIMKNFDLVGGEAVVMRAWHNSDATNIYEWQEDIQAAEAFQAYLINPAAILNIMVESPNSEEAKAWSTILQRATELELHLPHEKDLDGGWGEVLLAQGANAGDIPKISGDSIILTDPVTGEETIMHRVIGPGYEMVSVKGTDGNDTLQIILTPDTPSISYADGGAGDDIIDGNDDANILFGGTGNDTINGHGGNDWLHGGADEDTLDGGAGQDLVVGGADNDFLMGGDDTDHIYGNGGDDYLYSGGGSDYLYGGLGNDHLIANSAGDKDHIYGDEGDDILTGNGRDYMYGGTGNDHFISLENAASNVITIYRDEGHDIIDVNAQHRTVLLLDQRIGMNELVFKNDNDDLKIHVIGEKQSITVTDYFADTSLKLAIMGINGWYWMGDGNNSRSMINAMVNRASQIEPEGDYNYLSNSALANYEASFNFSDVWVHTNSGHQGTKITHGTTGNDPAIWLHHGENVFAMGGAGNDLITSNTSAPQGERMYGDSGNDIIKGNNGNDQLVGGMGNDAISGHYGHDYIYGGHGDDQLAGHWHNDELYGGQGNDKLSGGDGYDKLFGGDQDDKLFGGANDDQLYGENGNDVLHGEGGIDKLYGGQGNDNLFGGDGNDWLHGGAGDDVLTGGAGDDIINGGAGNDIITFEAGNDTIYGGDGWDKMNYTENSSFHHYTITGAYGQITVSNNLDSDDTDTLYDVEELIFLDAVYKNGALRPDTILTLDQVRVAEYGNLYNGQADSDGLISFGFDSTESDLELSLRGYDIDSNYEVEILLNGNSLGFLDKGNNQNLSTDLDIFTISAAEQLSGTNVITIKQADNITYKWGVTDILLEAKDFSEHLYGTADDDILYGGLGDDIITGGGGSDTLHGGSGSDTFVFTNPVSPVVDTFSGYLSLNEDSTSDRIQINRLDGLTSRARISVNLHFRTESENTHDGLLSYNTSVDNSLAITNTSSLHVAINGRSLDTGLALNDGEWHDLTLTWDRNDGGLRIYDHGELIYEGVVARGEQFRFSGVLTLGQEQDSMGGGFDADQSLTADYKGLAIWNRKLDADEIGSADDDALYLFDFTKPQGTTVIINENNSSGNRDAHIHGDVKFVAEVESNVDNIVDFNLADGDKIDVSDLLFNYDATTDVITDFIQITEQEGDSIVAIDYSGNGNNFEEVVAIQDTTGLTDEVALEASGVLIV